MDLPSSTEQRRITVDVDSGMAVSAVTNSISGNVSSHIGTPNHLKSNQHRALSVRTQEEPFDIDSAHGAVLAATAKQHSNGRSNTRHGRVGVDEVEGDEASSRPLKHGKKYSSSITAAGEVRMMEKRPYALVDNNEEIGEYRDLRRSSRTRKAPVQQQLEHSIQRRTKPQKVSKVGTRLNVSNSSPQPALTAPIYEPRAADFLVYSKTAVSARSDIAKPDDMVTDTLLPVSSTRSPGTSTNGNKNDELEQWTAEQKSLMSNLLKQQIELNDRQQSAPTPVFSTAVPFHPFAPSQSWEDRPSILRQIREACQTQLLPPRIEQQMHVPETEEQSLQHQQALLRQTHHMCRIQSLLPTIVQETHVQGTKPSGDLNLHNSHLRGEACKSSNKDSDTTAIDTGPASTLHIDHEISEQAHLRTHSKCPTDASEVTIDPTLMFRGPTRSIDTASHYAYGPEQQLDQIDIEHQHLLDFHQRYGSLLHGVQHDSQQFPDQGMMNMPVASSFHSGSVEKPFSHGSHEQEANNGLSHVRSLRYTSYTESEAIIDGNSA